MNHHGIFSFSTAMLGVCLLVLVADPDGANGSSRGILTSGRTLGSPSTTVGICASSVIIHGYKCQEFDVVTQDGYILSMQRIPQGRVGGGGVNKQPVLLQHGVLVDGRSWLLNSPEQNLPLILADNGFDVWITNTRGTAYSRRHISLDSNNPAFWNWSWDELVTYDLPAVFDFVHRRTGKKINYVGHSLGTLLGLASLSEGRLVDKMQSAAFLCPIAYLSHITPLGVLAAKFFLGEITRLFGFAEFNLKGVLVGNLLKALCADPEVDCNHMLNALTGKNCCLNASSVNLFMENGPQSTSTKNLVHLSQTIRDDVLAKYDYGFPYFNMMHYGDIEPPIYNLSNISRDMPIFMAYGGQDALSDVRDVQRLLDSFKFHDVEKLTVQYVKDYGHADFVMGVNAKDVVYNQVVSFFKKL